MEMQIKLLTDSAKMPSYAHADDAGMDLYADEKVLLEAGARVQVKSGIAVAIPKGHVGLLWDKSGLSHKSGLKMLGGVIDAGYRGEVIVGIHNLGTETVAIESGQKIAQMLIQPILQPQLTEVNELSATERGDGGFGSTGV